MFSSKISSLEEELREVDRAIKEEYSRMTQDHANEFEQVRDVRSDDHNDGDFTNVNLSATSEERTKRRELESENIKYANKINMNRLEMLIARKDELLRQISALEKEDNEQQKEPEPHDSITSDEPKNNEEVQLDAQETIQKDIEDADEHKVDLKSPINGSPLEPRGDGLYYSEHDDLFYVDDGTGEVKPIKSPINGSRLEPQGDGLFYSEHDDLYYKVDGAGKITPLKSEINGSRLEPQGDGLFYSEHDDLFYKVDETGKITPLKSEINGSRLEPKGDGTFYSEHDDSIYTIDENGTISLAESKANEIGAGTVSDDIKQIDNIENDEKLDDKFEQSDLAELDREQETLNRHFR